MRLITTIGLLLSTSVAWSQTAVIEQLKKNIQSARTTEQKLEYVFLLCEERQSLSTDTLFYYAAIAKQLAQQKNDQRSLSLASYEVAFCLARQVLLDSALRIIDAELIKHGDRDKELHSKFAMLKARVLDRSNRYVEALEQLYVVLKTAEQDKDTVNQIMAKTGIGWIQMEMGQPGEALNWLHSAERLAVNPKHYKNYGALFSNLASVYNSLGKNDSAEYFIKRSIDLSRQSGTLTFLATALNFQANIFIDTKRLKEAEASLKEALEIRKQVGDPYYTIPDMAQLALFYAKNNQAEKGIEICLEGIELAQQHKLLSNLPLIYHALGENYKTAGDMKKYSETLEKIIAVKDSLKNINASEALAEIQSKYDLQKRENVILQQQFDLTKKNYFIIGSLMLLLVVIVSGYFIFRENKRRQKIKTQMILEEEKRKAEQAVAEAEEAERKRIAADLHDNLGAQANAILYSAELLQQENTKEILVADLHHTATDMLTSLRETLWVLKNNEITASDIWIRIINFSKQINRHYPEIKIMTEGMAPSDLKLNSTRALNVVFIIQEAINNAVRHSSASLIRINSEFSAQQWRITISDDGKGFDLAAMNKKQESYGLSNMKERAATVSLDLSIHTEVNRGTNIELLVKDYP